MPCTNCTHLQKKRVRGLRVWARCDLSSAITRETPGKTGTARALHKMEATEHHHSTSGEQTLSIKIRSCRHTLTQGSHARARHERRCSGRACVQSSWTRAVPGYGQRPLRDQTRGTHARIGERAACTEACVARTHWRVVAVVSPRCRRDTADMPPRCRRGTSRDARPCGWRRPRTKAVTALLPGRGRDEEDTQHRTRRGGCRKRG
mmetsp:Transcript_36259/g.77329  ORF Transcript_36259/g.77329 Transcript_36259/m.77329 type:complete len:205 (-) Transcript_36259:68-682(-)